MEFALLGPLEVRDASGRRVDLGSRRQRALLAMLLLNANRAVGLDRIVDGLWGHEPPPKAVAGIQSYVSNLRRALEPDRAPRAAARVLVSRGSGYAIRIEPEQLDALRFEDLVTRGAHAASDAPAEALATLERALALWRGPVLSDIGAEPFAAAEVARLEGLRAAAEEDRVELLLRLGRTAEAIASLERLVEADPLRERPQRLLVVALYRSGRQVDALAAHRRHVTTLAEDYGLDPSPAFLAVRDAVLRHEPWLRTSTEVPTPALPARARGGGKAARAAVGADPSPSSTSTVSPEPRTARPTGRDGSLLLGRDDEFARLCGLLDRAAGGSGAVVLVSGEPGIGKSRLLEAVLEEATRRGMLAALGRCYEGGGAPAFWPFVEVARGLRAAADPEVGPHVDELMAAVRPETAPQEPTGQLSALLDPASRFLAAERIAASLQAVAAARPVVIGLDDVYGADPDSLEALVRLGSGVAAMPAVVVATLRTPAVADGHPLSAALGELVRLAHLERVAPRPLDATETRELLARESGQEPDAATVARVHARTGGNPFFTVEMGRLLRSEGVDPAREVPEGVRDVLRLRLARLPSETQSLLRVAAVQGRTFTIDVVSAVQRLAVEQALEHLEGAASAQLVAEDPGRPGVFRFTHVLVQEAIADSITALRRARLHGAVAEALRPTTRTRPDLWVRVAHHSAAAVPVTGPGPAIEALAAAALHAVTVNAYELAQQLVEQRLQLIAELPPGRERDLLELQAQVDLCAVVPITTGWHAPKLAAAGQRVQELGVATDDPDAVVRGLSAASANATVTGDYRRSLEIHPRQCELFAETGDATHGFLAAHGVAMVRLFRGELDLALREYANAERLIALADPGDAGRLRLPPDRMTAAAHHASLWAIARWMSGDAEGCARQLERAHAIATRDGHLQTIWTVWLSHLIVSACAGDAEDVAAGDRRRRDEAGDLESPLVDALLGVPANWAAAVLGDPTAADVAQALVSELTDQGALVFAALFRGFLADALLSSGRDEEALAWADDGLSMAERLGERMWEAELHRLRAIALHRLGRVADAVGAASAATATARRQGAVPLVDRAEATARHLGVAPPPGSSPTTATRSAAARPPAGAPAAQTGAGSGVSASTAAINSSSTS